MLITRITLRVITGYVTLDYIIIIRKLIFVNLWSERREYFKKTNSDVVNLLRRNVVSLSGVCIMISERADKAILICSGGFTQGVFAFVIGKPINLIDINKVISLYKEVNK